MSVYVRRDAGILTGFCLDCGQQNRQPDKGIGRANLAAWKTRHQHEPAPPTTPEASEAARGAVEGAREGDTA